MTVAGRKLKQFRKMFGYSQKQLSKELKVSTATISRLESGKQVPTVDLAYEVFKLTVGFIGLSDWIRGR